MKHYRRNDETLQHPVIDSQNVNPVIGVTRTVEIDSSLRTRCGKPDTEKQNGAPAPNPKEGKANAHLHKVASLPLIKAGKHARPPAGTARPRPGPLRRGPLPSQGQAVKTFH